MIPWFQVPTWLCGWTVDGKPVATYSLLNGHSGGWVLSACRLDDNACAALGEFSTMEKAEKAMLEHIRKYFPKAIPMQPPPVAADPPDAA